MTDPDLNPIPRLDDELAAAIEDDAPLPADPTRSRQDVALDVTFREPDPSSGRADG